MDVHEPIAIIGSVLGVGLALAVLIMRSTARIDADRGAADARAGTDRRTFHAEIKRLTENQGKLEGFPETSSPRNSPGPLTDR